MWLNIFLLKLIQIRKHYQVVHASLGMQFQLTYGYIGHLLYTYFTTKYIKIFNFLSLKHVLRLSPSYANLFLLIHTHSYLCMCAIRPITWRGTLCRCVEIRRTPRWWWVARHRTIQSRSCSRYVNSFVSVREYTYMYNTVARYLTAHGGGFFSLSRDNNNYWRHSASAKSTYWYVEHARSSVIY